MATISNPSNSKGILDIAKNNKMYIILFFTFIVIMGTLLYISNKLNLKTKNCSKLNTKTNSDITSITTQSQMANPSISLTNKLNECFIKTAYNCCCTGNFKNDYVDVCALKHCASYGVRALDFQIYSLNNKPIISASSVNSNQYKEIYNYVDFYTAMTNVRQFFIDDQSNKNSKDPLFLIFRLYSTNSSIYDMMYQSLDQVYGYSSPLSNMIYILPNATTTLDTITLSQLKQKVIIIVDTSHGDKNAFENSKLHKYTSLETGSSMDNRIYREGDLIGTMTLNGSIGNAVSDKLAILYPDLQANNNNYDFVTTGIFNYISFIGMNFQYNDVFLKEYNNLFSCAFMNKDKFIINLCNKSEYSSKFCTNIKSKST